MIRTGRRTGRQWAAAATGVLAAAGAAPAQTLHLEDARVLAHGNVITVSRVPLSTPSGTVYRDVRIALTADAAGNISIAIPKQAAPIVSRPAAPLIVSQPSPLIVSRPSPPLVVHRFLAGTYRTADGSGLFNVIDLGVPFGHATPRYKIAAIGAGGSVLDGATWDAGPMETNGLRHRLEDAGITDGTLAYGTSDGGSGGPFDDGALLGFAQRGDRLSVVSFRRGCCSDAAAPQMTLELDHVGG